MHILAKETFYKRFSFIQKTFQKHKSLKTKTLPQALRTQALTALTSNFSLVGLVWCVWFGAFGLVGLVW